MRFHRGNLGQRSDSRPARHLNGAQGPPPVRIDPKTVEAADSTSQASTRPFRRLDKRRLRILLRLGLVSFALTLLLNLACLAGPLRDRWPPAPDDPVHRIDVVYHDWHARIVERAEPGAAEIEPPVSNTPASADLAGTSDAYQEWDFAEQAWYLQGRQGAVGVVRTLVFPSASCVGADSSVVPPWSRAVPLERHWTFFLSEKGYRAMQDYMVSVRAEPLAEWPGWYSGNRSYHLFFNCNQFTAKALRRAGLPLRPWWAIYGPMIGFQLDRAQSFQPVESFPPEWSESGSGASDPPGS